MYLTSLKMFCTIVFNMTNAMNGNSSDSDHFQRVGGWCEPTGEQS